MKMNKYAAIAIVLATLLAAVSCTTPLERMFRELDATIEQKDIFRERFERQADSLRLILSSAMDDRSRWDCSYSLYSHYKYYQVDSSAKYLDVMLSCDLPECNTTNQLCRAEALISSRNYPVVSSILGSLDTLSMSGAELADYYVIELLLFANMAVDEFVPADIRQEMVEKRYVTRNKYLACGSADPFEITRREGIRLYEEGRWEESAIILENLWENETSEHNKAAAAYSLANAYLSCGDNARAEYWFAQSSIHDIREPARTYLSPYELANLLFEEKDYERASRYSAFALRDALDCHYTPRIYNSSNSQLSIVGAVETQAEVHRKLTLTVWITLILLLGLISYLLVRTYSKSLKLHQMSQKLREANKIKEGYLYRYMGLSAYYLDSVEELRHKLRVAIKEGKTDEINRLLRDPRFNDAEYDRFYQVFDETFLSIFPDFAEKVNALMIPEARFVIKNGEMPTGLRILALEKLGMTDSGSIAKFLSCAPSSVYTHRSKTRKKAVCSPEEFDKAILEI